MKIIFIVPCFNLLHTAPITAFFDSGLANQHSEIPMWQAKHVETKDLRIIKTIFIEVVQIKASFLLADSPSTWLAIGFHADYGSTHFLH